MNGAFFMAGATVSYLVGAVPFSFLFARLRGVNLCTAGSGNIGATNVFRTVGKGWGTAALAADLLKGFFPTWGLPRLAEFFWGPLPAHTLIHLGLMCGAAAVAGHTWPVYLRFRGGKGVATSAGVLLGIAPAAAGFGAMTWGALFALFGFVSLASMGAAATVAAAGWPLYGSTAPTLPLTLSLLGLLVIARHRANLSRLRTGHEPRAWHGLLSRSKI